MPPLPPWFLHLSFHYYRSALSSLYKYTAKILDKPQMGVLQAVSREWGVASWSLDL